MKAHCCGCLGWKMQTTHKKNYLCPKMDSYSNPYQCEICFRASQKERAAKLLEKIEHDEKVNRKQFSMR